MYTQNINELENSQNSIIMQWHAKLLTGIMKGKVNTEDSFPYVTIVGNFNKETGLKFAQDLANAMDINIFINRIETWYAQEDSMLHLMYDINPTNIKANEPVTPHSNIDEIYGIKIVPQLSPKLKM